MAYVVFLVLAVVCCWAGLACLSRRRAEGRAHSPRIAEAPGGAPTGSARDDGIDFAELERAERELRDLDAAAAPEDGFEGDDWGPGAGRTPG